MEALREGFTTGSCAAAAALACCLWQRDGVCPKQVSLTVPEGRTFTAEIVSHADGSCGVIKDSGDDPDITNGMEIVVRVEPAENEGAVRFAAGDGVGRITAPGLKLPVGEAAINPVPRQMIEEAVRSVFQRRACLVTVSIPGGRELAMRTFNPRLGIEGGLSVLGTSGIVRPMSSRALRDSLAEELNMRVAQGHTSLIYTFGNQGERAMQRLFPGIPVVQVSNEIGFMLDAARERGIQSILLGGHPGKLAKVAAGIMQTHSRWADGRREAIITQLARMNAPLPLIESVYACVTTDAAADRIHSAGFDAVWGKVAEAARHYCELRLGGGIQIRVVCLDRQGRILGHAGAQRENGGRI
ncbi:MAG: cobalamin biosynthesis protein CbiD [Clostridia bacterium]|nr:cobalamin biosynthesis protein CbiD [Clostridia bacterium]